MASKHFVKFVEIGNKTVYHVLICVHQSCHFTKSRTNSTKHNARHEKGEGASQSSIDETNSPRVLSPDRETPSEGRQTDIARIRSSPTIAFETEEHKKRDKQRQLRVCSVETVWNDERPFTNVQTTDDNSALSREIYHQRSLMFRTLLLIETSTLYHIKAELSVKKPYAPNATDATDVSQASQRKMRTCLRGII